MSLPMISRIFESRALISHKVDDQMHCPKLCPLRGSQIALHALKSILNILAEHPEINLLKLQTVSLGKLYLILSLMILAFQLNLGRAPIGFCFQSSNSKQFMSLPIMCASTLNHILAKDTYIKKSSPT